MQTSKLINPKPGWTGVSNEGLKNKKKPKKNPKQLMSNKSRLETAHCHQERYLKQGRILGLFCLLSLPLPPNLWLHITAANPSVLIKKKKVVVTVQWNSEQQSVKEHITTTANSK